MPRLPVQTQIVDMSTGEVTETKTTHFQIMPAPEGTCPDCAIKHDAAQPHNAQSLHYQYSFYAEHGRWPTWVDAMAHCSDDVRTHWTRELAARGVDVAGGKIIPDAEAQP